MAAGAGRRFRRPDPRPPTPGTKRVERVEENTTADGTRRTAEQITKLGNLAPASGLRRQPQRGGRVAHEALTHPPPSRLDAVGGPNDFEPAGSTEALD
ncbi:hypothetical protein [Streptomyces europaeiscabiei]|uniref:hypothetical protein n=1 Tax=Streptomyces europaeiscabiei TaxID=146819 RepID=UPI0038F81645